MDTRAKLLSDCAVPPNVSSPGYMQASLKVHTTKTMTTEKESPPYVLLAASLQVATLVAKYNSQ